MTVALFTFDAPPRSDGPGSPVLEVIAYGDPAPQGSKKAFPIYRGRGKDRVFTGHVSLVESSKKVEPWRDDVEAAAREAMGGVELRLDEDVLCAMVFTLPKPTGRPSWWPKDQRWSKNIPIRPRGYPDVSKLARSTEDALTTAGVWADDGRVVEYVRLAKFYPGTDVDALDRPGVLIRIYRLGDNR